MKKRKEKIWKIRRMLGTDYHLHESLGEEYKWKLYEKYDNWLTDNSEPIMTSDNYTIDDLYKFAKKHQKWEELLTISKFQMIFNTIIMILILINAIFIKNKIFSYIIDGILIYEFIMAIVSLIISKHNLRISDIKYKEHFYRQIQGVFKDFSKK